MASLRAIDTIRVDSVAIEKESGSFVVLAHVRGDGGERLGELLSPIARRDDVATMRVGDVGD